MVVETPDSIFVSDIDHSRDVKSIVARLKEKGRKEYHQHRTIHFPWGSQTVLEQKEGYAVYRLLVYPQSTLQVEVGDTAFIHLIATKGTANVGIGGKIQDLNQGRALTLSKPGPVAIDNKSDEPIWLIQVQLGM